jgi:6-phosphogluconolactonase
MQKINHWHQFATADDVADEVTQRILQLAGQAIAERGQFSLVLAGGGTPEKIYQRLAQADSAWENWRIYYGDERCLPADDPERNSVMAQRTLLSQVAIPPANIFTMPTELGPVKAAEAYRNVMQSVDSFDLVLLGMGEDGHTASLFPGHEHDLEESEHEVYNSPKPPPERISLSAKALSNARQVYFIVTGASKVEPLQQWRTGKSLPVTLIRPVNGIDIFLDAAALGQ